MFLRLFSSVTYLEDLLGTYVLTLQNKVQSRIVLGTPLEPVYGRSSFTTLSGGMPAVLC